MNLFDKSILIVSPEPWNHIFVSKHHYAVHLAKRENRVFFLNPPSKANNFEETDFKNVFSVKYTGFIPGLRFFPHFVQHYFIKKKYNELQRICNVNFDVVWSFDNSVFYDFSALPNNILKISHIVDLNQDFQFKKATLSATICLGLIPEIVERQRKLNTNSFLIRHGLAVSTGDIESTVLPGLHKVKALYVGNLYMPYIDWECFCRAATKYEAIDFIFLGSNQHLIKKHWLTTLRNHSNIHFVSAVPSHNIPAYLAGANILTLAYTPEYYKIYASPHKLMEYLYSGKPIVASFTPGYETHDNLVYMGRNQNEWLEKFSYVVENLAGCSADSLMKLRKHYALNNTYDKQLDRINKIIGDLNVKP